MNKKQSVEEMYRDPLVSLIEMTIPHYEKVPEYVEHGITWEDGGHTP